MTAGPRLVARSVLLVPLVACGARTSIDDTAPSRVADDGGAFEDREAAGVTSAGVLCAVVDGVESSCDAPERAGPVQRCEPGEQCAPVMIPNVDVGYHTVYECCASASDAGSCATRQFSASYVCQ